MTSPPRPRFSLQLILGLWFAFYCTVALFAPPLLDDADSVHAEVAREMVVRGDPVTLYANGIRYLEKAPLLYWSMAGSMRLLGVHTATARLPLALYTLLLLLAVEWLGRVAFRSARAGLYAAMVLLSSFGIFIFTRILIPDAIVCLWYVLAVGCFWLTERQGGRAPLLPCLGFGVACALNVLTKGLIGLVFPVGTVLLYLLFTRGLSGAVRRVAQLRTFSALLAFLAVAAPWHIAAGLANPTEGHPAGMFHTGHLLPFFWRGWTVPEPTPGNVHGWTWFYFMNEHVLRYMNLRVPRDYDTVPLLLFWGLLFAWLLPWSAYLPQAVASVPWRGIWKRGALKGEQDRTLLLLGIAAVLPVLFFSFSTRQEYYVLPSLPFFALLIGRWLDREVTEADTLQTPAPLHRASMRSAVVLLAVGSVAAIACGFFLLHTAAPNGHEDLANLLQQNPSDYALSFGHFLDLNARAMGLFRLPLAITGVSLFCGTLAAWWLRSRYRAHDANMALLGTALAFLFASYLGLNTFAPVLTSKHLADAIRREQRPGELVVLNDEYEGGSTLGFYLQRDDIHILHGHSANLWYGSFFNDAPKIFEDDLTLRSRWLTTQRIYLWTAPEKMPKLPTRPYLVAEGGGKMVVSNQPNRY